MAKKEYRKNKSKKKSNKTLKVIIPAVVIIIVAAIVVWFFAIYKDSDNTQDSNNDSHKTKIEPADVVDNKEVASKLPKGFPVDKVSIYNDASAIKTDKSKGEKSVTKYVVSFKSSSTVNDIFDFYKSELSRGDWTITSNAKYAESSLATINAENVPAKLRVSVTISKNDNNDSKSVSSNTQLIVQTNYSSFASKTN